LAPLFLENIMTQPLLRHKPSGILYVWQEAFAFRDDFEEVVEATPEEIKAPETLPPAKLKKTAKPAPAKIDVEALSADASFNLPT
jgi:hypothetical protein